MQNCRSFNAYTHLMTAKLTTTKLTMSNY